MYGIALGKIRLQYRLNDGCLIHLIIEAIYIYIYACMYVCMYVCMYLSSSTQWPITLLMPQDIRTLLGTYLDNDKGVGAWQMVEKLVRLYTIIK